MLYKSEIEAFVAYLNEMGSVYTYNDEINATEAYSAFDDKLKQASNGLFYIGE